jgi:lipoprotein-anchoring transpeptidase ErfK/SrfK
MHAGVIPKPGEAASHGCIRLPRSLAPKLFDVVKVGTTVTITH